MVASSLGSLGPAVPGRMCQCQCSTHQVCSTSHCRVQICILPSTTSLWLIFTTLRIICFIVLKDVVKLNIILSGGYMTYRASMQSCANARSLVNTAGNVYESNWDILYSSPYLFSRQCQCSQWRNWRMCNNFIQYDAPWDLTPRLGSEKQT